MMQLWIVTVIENPALGSLRAPKLVQRYAAMGESAHEAALNVAMEHPIGDDDEMVVSKVEGQSIAAGSETMAKHELGKKVRAFGQETFIGLDFRDFKEHS